MSYALYHSAEFDQYAHTVYCDVMESSGDISPVEHSRGSRDRLQQRARDLKADGNPAWRLYSKEAALCTLTVIVLIALAAQ